LTDRFKGKFNKKEGAYKSVSPREDIAVSVDGWKIPAFMGLSTWAAFTNATHSEAMVIGDTVLFEDEVNLAMFVALERGLSITALHNHFFFDHPRLFFMHVEGEGTVERLASSVRLLYDKVREYRTAHPTPADSFVKPALPDVGTIPPIPGIKFFIFSGEVNKGMIKFTFRRQSHMISEEPRIIFFHYWGRGSAQNLAQSIQKALLATAGTPAKPRASEVRTSASVTRYVQIL
jgi:hypothetical protein